jgi:hypothetical protein
LSRYHSAAIVMGMLNRRSTASMGSLYML